MEFVKVMKMELTMKVQGSHLSFDFKVDELSTFMLPFSEPETVEYLAELL
jgi:hypothetical protein